MQNSPVITIMNLVKRFPVGGGFFTALKDIDLTLLKGEFMGLIGPSGSGKTTLLNIIGGLDSPSEGKVSVLGKALDNTSHGERAKLRREHMGFIFQSYNLLPVYTVFENVELPLIYTGVKPAERKKRVDEVLEKMQIMHRRKHFPQQLSGGQQQRVAVARAVVNNPKLILADEPTGNLDSSNGNEVMDLLTELNEAGTTIIMVTHSEHDAKYSHRIIRMLDGQKVTENVLTEYKSNTLEV